MNWIYMYKNLKNSKKYIGQTNNLERRKNEHRSVSFNPISGNFKDYFHQALRKHGEDKFEIIVLYSGDCDQEQLNKLEIDFIQRYKTHVSQWGYNLTWGGQGAKKESQYDGELIKQRIIEGIKYLDIKKEFNCSLSFISSINWGYRFYDSKINYPLRKQHDFNGDEIYPQMINLLQDPRYRFQEIADRLNCSYATVKSFNAGNLAKHKYWQGDYPIRDRYFCDKPNWYYALELLQTTKLSMRKIARNYAHISDKVLTDINHGIKIPQPGIKYPIR